MPCQNDAECLQTPDGMSYSCLCTPGKFMLSCWGSNCNQYDIFFLRAGNRDCKSVLGWKGINCAENINECNETMPCQNGATCIDEEPGKSLVICGAAIALLRLGNQWKNDLHCVYFFSYFIIFFTRPNEQVTIARVLTDGKARTAQTTSTSVSRTRVNTAEPATTPSIASTVPAPVVRAMFPTLLGVIPSQRRWKQNSFTAQS